MADLTIAFSPARGKMLFASKYAKGALPQDLYNKRGRAGNASFVSGFYSIFDAGFYTDRTKPIDIATVNRWSAAVIAMCGGDLSARKILDAEPE